MNELLPHDYVPSVEHMGDCAVCGHVQGAEIHTRLANLPVGPSRFFWVRRNGINHCVKVAEDMVAVFMQPDGSKVHAPKILAQHQLKDEEREMTLKALSLRYPCPAYKEE